MAIYTILTEEELLSQTNLDIQNFILNNFADNAANPNRIMLKFDDSLPASLSSYDSYTESQVQTMQSDSSSDWYLQ